MTELEDTLQRTRQQLAEARAELDAARQVSETERLAAELAKLQAGNLALTEQLAEAERELKDLRWQEVAAQEKLQG